MTPGLHEEELLGKVVDTQLMKRLWPYLRPHWKLVAASLALIPLRVLLEMIPASLFGSALNHLAGIDKCPDYTVDGKTYTGNDYLQFINPGDLRVAQEACGGCHQKQVNNVPKSTMATAQTFWAAASYANGILGEHYTRDGEPGMIKETRTLTDEEKARGALPVALPLPRWELIQPGEYLTA